MKLKARFLSLFLFFLASMCFSQGKTPERLPIPQGIELCRQIRTICREKGLNYSTSPLVSSVENFNISVVLPSSAGNPEDFSENYRKTLVFIISQEDFYKKSDFYTNLLSKLSAEKRNFDIVFLLSFPENHIYRGFSPVSGKKAFLQSLDSTEDYACVFLKPEADTTKVISGAGRNISPSWIVRYAYNAINKNKILPSFRACYISFLYKQNIVADPVLSDFILSGIPSVSVSFDKNLPDSSYEDFIMDFCSNYRIEDTYQNDTHSIMFSFHHKSFWITEETITKEILIVIFFTFLLLFFYGFLNSNLRLKAWKKIKNIWFYPIIIYFISLSIFYTFRKMMSLYDNGAVFISTTSALCFILPMVFTVQCFFFFSTLRFAPYFRRRTVDYLTLITSSINLVVFSLIDISLFPIFGFEFILAWISTVFTRNFIHFLILILFELPFLPYLNQFFTNATPFLVDSSLRNSNYMAPALFLILLPQYLNSFRVFTGMNYYWFFKKKSKNAKERNNLIILAVFLCFFEAILFIILPPYLREKTTVNETQLLISEEPVVSARINKRKIFDENLTTLIIHSDRELEVCDVRVIGKDSNPVIFSDNDFISPENNETVFQLPPQPPKDMILSFGSGNQPFEILIKGVYRENDSYYVSEIKVDSE